MKNVQLITPIKERFRRLNYSRNYSTFGMCRVKKISVTIPANTIGNRIFLPQDPEIDRSTIEAIEFIPQEKTSYTTTGTGSLIENLTEAQIGNFTFTLAKNDENKFTIPAALAIRGNNSGKFCFVNSIPNRHRIGDSYLTQTVAQNLSGTIVSIRIYFK